MIKKGEKIYISVSISQWKVLPFHFAKKAFFDVSPHCIGLMRSGKIEPITSMGVNSRLQPPDTVEEGL